MMGIVAHEGVDPEIVASFRQQARGHVAPGDSPAHADGWGIVYHDEAGRPVYAGRSIGDALTDPAYVDAVNDLRKRQPRGVVMAHVRKASAGAPSIDNTHPFLLDHWSFCHNGTVFGLAEDKARGGEAAGPRSGRAGMWGFAPEGQSDSRAIFAALHEDIRKRKDIVGAIQRLVDEVACMKYTSLTFLLSDGRSLYGYRKVGNVDEECRENACSPDYYTLGIGRLAGQTIVSQEHEFLGLAGSPWRVVPDGHLVTVGPDGHARVESLAAAGRV